MRSLTVFFFVIFGLFFQTSSSIATEQIEIRIYVPAASASSGYVSYLRIINKGSVATPVTVTAIDGLSGLAWATGTLTASLPANAAVTYTAEQVEAAMGITLSAIDRPRIRITANTAIESQSYLAQPGGSVTEISDALGSASAVIIRNYVPAAMATAGYLSYLRIVNSGTAATPVTVARVDPATGLTGADGTLNASLPAGAAISYSATEIEAALGAPIAVDERSRIKVTGTNSQLEVQTYLLQPDSSFTNHSSGQSGSTVDVRNYVPAALTGYTTFIRVINDGTIAAQVTAALIDDMTGIVGSSAVLISSLPAAAATSLSSSQVEAALGINISASARPRIRISAPVMLAVQSFLLQPGGALNEMSNAASGTSVDIRTYIPAVDAGSGYISYLRVINTGPTATPVGVALIDGTSGIAVNSGTLIASLPPGGAQVVSSAQVEAALGAQVASGTRPRIRLTGNTILEVQSYLAQPGGAFAEVSGGQVSNLKLITGLMGGAIQGNELVYIPNMTTLAGSATAGAADGSGSAALFSSPFGITTDGTKLYVADFNNHKIREVVTASAAVTTMAGQIEGGAVDGTGTSASFRLPFGITTDGSSLYVADGENNKIRKIAIASGEVTTLAGSGSIGATDGTGTEALFNAPYGITTDNNNLYVADTYNHIIRKIVIASGAVTTLAGSGTVGAADGIGTGASFNTPYGITTTGTNLYVADTYNHKIRKIVIASGEVTTLAGSGTIGATDGIGTAALFNAPYGITADGTNLYVADTDNHKIRKIAIASGSVSTMSFLSVNTTLQQPIGITTDGNSLYVTQNHRIIKMMPPPTVTGMVPASGSTGETITVIGANFDTTPSNNTVKFNGTQAVVMAATATTITVTVPSGATTGPVSVQTAVGTAASTGSFTKNIPAVSVNPASLTFASQNLGTTSAAQTVTLSNTGNGTLNISSIAVGGDYARTTTCGATLAAGANCTISVTFTPAASGARTGTLTITSNAATSPTAISLSGTGFVPPVLSITPATLTFPLQNVGLSSAPYPLTLSNPLTLTNTGSSALNLNIVANGDYTYSTNCGTFLNVASSCTISVIFTPIASGARAGTLTITSNAANSPLIVNLNGTGVGILLTTINATCTVNQACDAPLVANVTGGTAPYHFQQDSFMYGLRPLNTNIDVFTGNIIGTPTQTGTYTFNLCVVDTIANQNCQPVTVTVNSNQPLTGTWTGTWAWSGPGPNGCQYSDGGTFSMTLTQTGSSFSGSTSGAGIQWRWDIGCAVQYTQSGTGSASGTITGTNLNLSFDLAGMIFTGTATLNGNTLTATFVRSSGGQGSFTVTKP
ncbi:MAG: choice-of-anchor D domain-containing protein [Gallionella sp.]|nr:choice-of-anchor D domain-containing protein [Gallionella sp.]